MPRDPFRRTALPYQDALDAVADAVKKTEGLKVYAAEVAEFQSGQRQGWRYYGFLLAYPDGTERYVCTDADMADHLWTYCRYIGVQNYVALLLQKGERSDKVLDKAAKEIFRLREEGQRNYNDALLVSIEEERVRMG